VVHRQKELDRPLVRLLQFCEKQMNVDEGALVGVAALVAAVVVVLVATEAGEEAVAVEGLEAVVLLVAVDSVDEVHQVDKALVEVVALHLLGHTVLQASTALDDVAMVKRNALANKLTDRWCNFPSTVQKESIWFGPLVS
jgi:hypothetical protein